MRSSTIPRTLVLATLALACQFVPDAAAATLTIGSGADSSMLVLESANLGVRTYEIRYSSGSAAPRDAADLLFLVIDAEPTLTISLANFGNASQPNYFVNQITYEGISETGVVAPPYEPYWAHWASGGAVGFPESSPMPSGTWTEGSGISAPYREIFPGSWDALVYSDGSMPPSVTPVPEPGTTLFVLAGTLTVLGFRRRFA